METDEVSGRLLLPDDCVSGTSHREGEGGEERERRRLRRRDDGELEEAGTDHTQ